MTDIVHADAGLPETFAQQALPGFNASDRTMVFMAQLAERWRVAKIIASSGLTKHRTPEAILAIMMWGYELDVPPMLALRNMYFFDGNLGMSADLMAALFIRAGGKIEVLEWTAEKFRARFSREGWEPSVIEYTVEDAREAGLLNKPNWKNKKAMLSARCRAMGCRAIAPDVFAGQYTAEELSDFAPEGGARSGTPPSAGAVVARELAALAAGGAALSAPAFPDAVLVQQHTTPAFATLDAAGLTGEADPAGLGPDAEPADANLAPAPSTGKVAALHDLLAQVTPGKAHRNPASMQRRERLRGLAQDLFGTDDEASDRLLSLAGEGGLSEADAKRLVDAAFAAALELGVEVSGAARGELPTAGT